MAYEGLLPEHEKIRENIEKSWSLLTRISRRCYKKPEIINWELPVISIPYELEKELEYEQVQYKQKNRD